MADEHNETDHKFTVSDLVIDTIYVLAIGINVYVITDQMTNGALSREVSLHLTRLRGRLIRTLEKRSEFRRSLGRMFWEAETTIEQGEVS